MKKILILAVLSCFSAIGYAQVQQSVTPKLSPLTKAYLSELGKTGTKTGILPGYVYKKLTNGAEYTSALIKVSDATTAEGNLDGIGALVGTKAGNIWTVLVPAEKTAIFTTLVGISYIQLDEPVFPKLNVARKTTRVDSVHAGYNLPMAYSGKNVVVGVIDFGFDYNHPTFYDTLKSHYRIKKVWEMGAAGTPPTGYTYGKEITDTNAIKAEGTDNAQQYHGTCTTGMIAGSGYGGDSSNSKYRGMAYDADIVLVGVRRDSIGGQWLTGSFTDFIDGLNYIFNYAQSVGKPAVISISWGSESGSHDGTSLFNQACDNLSGPGKIIVMAAGNEGGENLHLHKSFTATDTVLNTFLSFTNTYKRTWVDIWGDTGKTFCASVTLYNANSPTPGATTNFVCTNDSVTSFNLIGANGTDTCYVQFISTPSEQNDKPRTTITVFNKAADNVNVTIKADEGSINAWNESYYYGYTYGYASAFTSLNRAWATNGNDTTAISDMGSAQSVLLIGAYTSKVSWTDINSKPESYGNSIPVNQLTYFSSRGPMIDGRIKPDITAPGFMVATSVSSYDTLFTPTGANSYLIESKYADPVTSKNYYYADFDGTSAATPAAAGIVALMLQANPNLTPQQVKNTLFETAITDSYTGTIPAAGLTTWGHGKINAYGAVKKVVQDEGVYSFTGTKMDCTLFPNPNNGSFMLDYSCNKADNLVVSVYDVTGRLISAKNWQVNNGTNRYNYNMQNAAKGIYIVHVTGTNGSVEIKNVIR